MRIKSADRNSVRKWKRQQEEWGYCPHYHRRGRILMEVRFLENQPRDGRLRVINEITGEILLFRRNGTPLGSATGLLVGALVIKRKIRHA